MDEEDDMLPIALEPQLNDNEETLTALQSHEQRSREDGTGMTYEDLCKAHIVSLYLLLNVRSSLLQIFFEEKDLIEYFFN